MAHERDKQQPTIAHCGVTAINTTTPTANATNVSDTTEERMMGNEKTYSECVALAEHYIAVGQTEIHLFDTSQDLPWALVSDVVAGGSYRLNGLSSARCIAPHPCGLTFKWFIDFEGYGANGTGTNQFDANMMLGAARRMPIDARRKFAYLLRNEVLSSVEKRTEEVRDALKKQEESMYVLCEIMTSVDRESAR